MKKLSIAVAALAWAGLAQAGEYHRLGQLRCTDCHTMHASRQHGFAQDGTGVAFPGGAATITPNDRLLIANGVNATCLACHDGQTFAPDVLGADISGGTVRSAGHLNDAADTANVTHGHTLDSTATPPGFATAGVTWAGLPVECENCHAVHGSRAYRNAGLGRVAVSQGFTSSGATSFSNQGATYNFKLSIAQADPTVDVSILSDGDGVALDHLKGLRTNSYRTQDIVFGKGSGNATNAAFTGAGYPGVATAKVLAPNGMNTFCARCHGNFHGTTNTAGSAAGLYIRHPTSDVVRTDTTFTGAFTGVQGTDPMVAFDSAQGDLVRAVFTDPAKGSFEVGCLTCHKAHGNDRPFGLIYPSHVGAVADYENGDATALADGTYPIRNLCVTCHPMGRTY